MPEVLQNFIGGRWLPSSGRETLDVFNPARGVVIAKTPMSTAVGLDAGGAPGLSTRHPQR